MTLFARWNDLLLSEFFSLAASQEEVWLNTSRAELDSFGLHLGGAEGLVDAVKTGPEWLKADVPNCADAALRLARHRGSKFRPNWYTNPEEIRPVYKGFNAPAYLPILALWVLASSEQDRGFYARVSELLSGASFRNTQALTRSMVEVWEKFGPTMKQSADLGDSS